MRGKKINIHTHTQTHREADGYGRHGQQQFIVGRQEGGSYSFGVETHLYADLQVNASAWMMYG